VAVEASEVETQLAPGLPAVRYEGRYGPDDFLEQGGASSDARVVEFLSAYLGGAAGVEEALALLEQYDLRSSMGMMIHFALADTGGNSVAVDYIGNESGDRNPCPD